MSVELDSLPKTVQELIGVVGLPAAIAIVKRYPGLTLVVPQGRTESSSLRKQELVDLIGDEAFVKLLAAYGTTPINVPRCYQHLVRARWARIVAEYNAGTPVASLALDHQITERAVWKILKQPVQQDDIASLLQQSLF